MEILLEYYFKIKYIKGTDNARVNTLSWKTELQGLEKLSGAILKLHENGKIRYNYLKLAVM